MSIANRLDQSDQQLIEQAQPMVRSLATQIRRNLPVGVDLDDLIAYGQVGLVEAAKDFDRDQGSKFTTYAYYRIRGAIYDGVSKMSWMSRARYKRIQYHSMANDTLRRGHDQSAPAAESSLAGQAEWFGNVTEKLAIVYLTSHAHEQPGVRDSALQDRAATPVAAAAGREICAKLRELVSALPTPARLLIQTTYFEGATLREAARRLGISKSWASRLHAKTLEDLARSLRKVGAGE
ncbi:MAG: hypothetical protein A2W31_01430 [Planctomycetes bacterium RBG_16_64_10]|nr:MAG: hypothetical protein A2W31_01430 [Planctomycetes bacterium RBG_16_64_10]